MPKAYRVRFVAPRVWNEESLVRRIAAIVGPTSGALPWRKDESTWVLNASNDWWLARDDASSTSYELRTRYPIDEEILEALRVVIEWVLR